MFSFLRSFLLSLFVLFPKLGLLGLGFQPPPFDFFETRSLLFYRMKGSTPASLLKRKWGLKRWDANEKERPITVRDSDLVSVPGFETREAEFPQEAVVPIHRKKEWAYQVGDTTRFRHSDRLVQGTVDCIGGYLKQNSADLSLGQIGHIASAERALGITGSCSDHLLVVDAVENSTSSGTTSSYSLKDLGQLQFAHSMKNVYTARPVEESEAMRKWKEIKQNGFLSHPHGGIPVLEPQHGKKSKRKAKRSDQKRKMEIAKEEQDNRKMETLKGEQDRRKIETAKGGQDNRKGETIKGEQENMLKTAPSSGLLSRISTGIIRRVKNYEEVHAILEDMVQLEKHDSRTLREFIGREGSEGKEIFYTTNSQNEHFQYLNGASFPPCSDQEQKGVISENSEERSYPEHGDGSHDSDNAEGSFGHEAVIASECFSGHDKKLPLTITSSDVSVKACDGASSGKLKSSFSESNKGASYDFEWLALTWKDSKGHLLMLQRGKKIYQMQSTKSCLT